MKKGLFHRDSVSIEEGSKLALFVNGIEGPVTPAAAYAAMMDGESESAAAARERMIARHGGKKRSATAAEGRATMIQRQGRRDQTSE